MVPRWRWAIVAACRPPTKSLPADRHAEVVSSYLLTCYVGSALPVVGVGFVAQAIGPANAHRMLGGLVAALAVLAAVIALHYGNRTRPSASRRRRSRSRS